MKCQPRLFISVKALNVVLNIHERRVSASPSALGELLASLGGSGDRLWPKDRWPALRLDGSVRRGACGGHGPIRYCVEEYVPGALVTFRFTRPTGFDGTHSFHVIPVGPNAAVLRHVLEMETTGKATLTWPLIFRPLHDALIEDALDQVEEHFGQLRRRRRWSPRVRLLRALLKPSRRTQRPG